MKKLEIKAPAKINIGLKVTGKREDGYHNIETVFYPVNLHDVITFNPSETLSFLCKNNKELNDGENSVLKAVITLQEYCKREFKISIVLTKNIPVGAGMGGGSSDAAATILALNEYFSLKLEKDTLYRLALKLGSDVPFFISPSPSYAVSRGEILTEIKLRIPNPILIVNPGIHISTKWAYNRIKPGAHEIDLLEVLNLSSINFSLLKDKVKNDFEEVVFKEYSEIKAVKENLYKYGASYALMTGSGSTVFGIFENLNAAEKAKKMLPKSYFRFIHQNIE